MPPLLSFLLIAISLVVAGVIIAFLVRRRRAAVRAAHVVAATMGPDLTQEEILSRIGVGGDLPTGLAAPADNQAEDAAVAGADDPAVEPPLDVSTRRRLWRDAAGVLLVTSLVLLAVSAFGSGTTSRPVPSAPVPPTPVAVALTPSPPPSHAPTPGPSGDSMDPLIASPAPTLPSTPGQTPAVAVANDAPDARADAFTVDATGAGTLAVLDNDVSAPASGPVTPEPAPTLAVTALTQGTKVSVSIAADGAGVRYNARACATGDDSFTYTVRDGEGRTDTATVSITIARPGQDGLSSSPITDRPTVGFIADSTIDVTVPARLSWCGVTRRGSGVRSYIVQASGNAGATYPMTVISRSTARSIRRDLPVGPTFRWRARTTDTAGRTGSWRYSSTARVTRYQETDPALTFAGAWTTHATGNASGGGQRSAGAAGASASVTLTDVRQFAIVGPRSANRGSFEVWVDGAKVATVSERASATVHRRVLYVGGLARGPGVSHAIEVRAVGDGRIDIDAVLALS